MKVGLVCPYDLSRSGGVQGQVLDLASKLAEVGDEPVVMAPGLGESVEGVDLGAAVAVPANRSRAPISLDPRVAGRISEAAQSCDVLHVHEPLMPTVSWSALRAGPPVVATFHAAPGAIVRTLYLGLSPGLKRLLKARTRRVTAVSATAAAVLPGGLEVRIIPNGVDVDSLLVATERHPKRICFLGRDEPRKGLDILLAAWPRIRAAVPESELWVMGAERAGEGVKWLGRVDNETKAEVLSSSAIYVAPNTGGESFGITLVEAMAAGAAVVASNLSSFVDVAQDAARYFPVGDTKRLGDDVIELLENPGLCEVLASRGEVRAPRFDWSRVLAEYRSEYQAAVS